MLKAYLAALALVVSGSCFAQANVGDVMKQGGVKMTKEQVQQLHAAGPVQTGTLNNGTPYKQQYKARPTARSVATPVQPASLL